MGFRTYRELEEAYNNLESEYLLRENTSLFSEMHNYISENIVELPYCESYFTEASSKNILQKIWDFIVKCWKNLVSFISKIGNILKRLVSNSEKALDRLDKLIEMNAAHMNLDPKKIQQELDDKYMNNKGLDEVFNDIDNIVKKIEAIDPEAGSAVAAAYKGAKTGKKLGEFISHLLGLSAGTALATKTLGVINANATAGAAGAAAGADTALLTGIGPAGFAAANMSTFAGHVTANHMAAGGATAGATAVISTGGAAAVSTANLKAGASIGTKLTTIVSKIGGQLSTMKGGWAAAGCLGALGISVAAIGTVAGVEKLINELGADQKELTNARLFLPVLTQTLNKKLLVGYVCMSAILASTIGLVDIDPFVVYPSSNDAFNETIKKDIIGISRKRFTFSYLDSIANFTNLAESAFKKTVFSKSRIIIWRFLPKDLGKDAVLVEKDMDPKIDDISVVVDSISRWFNAAFLTNSRSSKSHQAFIDVLDVLNEISKDKTYLDSEKNIKDAMDKTSKLLTYLSNHKNSKTSKDSSGTYVKFLQSSCRGLSALGAAAAARSAVYFKLVTSATMQGGLVDDIEKLLKKIF